jgi:hypothetical protein
MKKIIGCFAIAGLLALGGSAIAAIGTVDDVPAATLLLPYFEVDLDNAAGLTTLFSINNASAAPALVHVVVWTDLSIHILDFNVYLSGYDVFTQNLRDLLIAGTSPQTQDGPLQANNPYSPKGIFSLPNVTYPSCNLPYGQPLLNASYLAHVQAALTGQASNIFGAPLCMGADHGDNIARGYITMDNVNDCSLLFPEEPGYFVAGGLGFANNNNQLWGDYFYVNPGENFAQGETLVHVEGDDTLGPANYTFYYRFATLGADNREGLGSTFAVRYLQGAGFDGGTDLLVWRDGKKHQGIGFSCNLTYPPTQTFPLGNDQIVIFDEQENPVVPEGCTISPCPEEEGIIPFPIEAQRTSVGSLPIVEPFGWLYLNLNNPVTGSPVDTSFPGIMQNWVTAAMSAEGRYSVGFDAIQLDNVTDGLTQSLCLGEEGAVGLCL